MVKPLFITGTLIEVVKVFIHLNPPKGKKIPGDLIFMKLMFKVNPSPILSKPIFTGTKG